MEDRKERRAFRHDEMKRSIAAPNKKEGNNQVAQCEKLSSDSACIVLIFLSLWLPLLFVSPSLLSLLGERENLSRHDFLRHQLNERKQQYAIKEQELKLKWEAEDEERKQRHQIQQEEEQQQRKLNDELRFKAEIEHKMILEELAQVCCCC